MRLFSTILHFYAFCKFIDNTNFHIDPKNKKFSSSTKNNNKNIKQKQTKSSFLYVYYKKRGEWITSCLKSRRLSHIVVWLFSVVVVVIIVFVCFIINCIFCCCCRCCYNQWVVYIIFSSALYTLANKHL